MFPRGRPRTAQIEVLEIRALVIVAGCACLLAACGSSVQNGGMSEAHPCEREAGCDVQQDAGSCIVRAERYTSETIFPLDRDGASVSLAQCVPTCGAPKSFDFFFSEDALPAGECDPGTSACDMPAHDLCP
jgi:hypothetical protein